MITEYLVVNGTEFRVTLTDQIIGHVNNLKNLYATAYEDPESFETVSSEISSTIQEIATSVEPQVSDGDLDGLIQEIIIVVDNKATEMNQQMSKYDKDKKSKPKKRPRF